MKATKCSNKDEVKRFIEAYDAEYAGYKQALEKVRNGRKVCHYS